MQVFLQTEIDLHIKVISFCQVSFFSVFPKGSTGWPCKGEKRKGKQKVEWGEREPVPLARSRKVLQPFTWQSKRQRTSANNVWVDFLSPTLQVFTFTYSLSQISQNLACIKCCCMILLIYKTLKCLVKPTRLTKHSKPIHCFLYRFKMYICPCYNHWMNAVRCMGVIKYIYILFFFKRVTAAEKTRIERAPYSDKADFLKAK